MITAEERARLRELAQAATKGPLAVYLQGEWPRVERPTEYGSERYCELNEYADSLNPRGWEQAEADGRYIAATDRGTVLALLDAVDDALQVAADAVRERDETLKTAQVLLEAQQHASDVWLRERDEAREARDKFRRFFAYWMERADDEQIMRLATLWERDDWERRAFAAAEEAREAREQVRQFAEGEMQAREEAAGLREELRRKGGE